MGLAAYIRVGILGTALQPTDRQTLSTSVSLLSTFVSCRFLSYAADLRAAYGAPDLALLPIAPGSILPYIERLLPFIEISDDICRQLHLTPLDALDVARDLEAKRVIGVHWGTFSSLGRARRTVRTVNEINRLEIEMVSRSGRDGLDEPTSAAASVKRKRVQLEIGHVGQTWTV